MRLEKASSKAIKYACLKFHYSKSMPLVRIAYSVFNDKNEWCGVITFGGGAGSNMGKTYNLVQGQYLELTRMALNGKQECTSKAMAIAIRLIKKDSPTVQLLISYADKGQDHYGTIYQACNWIFVDESESSGQEIFWKGRWHHTRVRGSMPLKVAQQLPKRKKAGKRKYLYALNKKINRLIQPMGKSYPKKLDIK